MIPASRQRNYLQSALYVAIAGVLAAVLLERLLTYAEAAEKAAMEATVARLNAALYTRVAYLTLRGDVKAVEEMPRQSPFVVTMSIAGNYLGEFDGKPADAKAGRWFYDRQKFELVYLPNLKRYFSVPGAEQASPSIPFRLELAKSSPRTVIGVALKPTKSYLWEPLP